MYVINIKYWIYSGVNHLFNTLQLCRATHLNLLNERIFAVAKDWNGFLQKCVNWDYNDTQEVDRPKHV